MILFADDEQKQETKYHVYDFFNQEYSFIGLEKINLLIEGENPLYVANSKKQIDDYLKII